MKTYKVLYVVSTLRATGPTSQLYGLVKNLERNNFQPYILTLSPEPNDSRIEDFKKLNINMDSLLLSRTEMILKGKKKLIKRVNEINPDLIHTFGIRPDTYIQNYVNNKFLHCMTIRNYVYDDYPVKFGKIKGSIMAKRHMNIISNAQFSISCSKFLANLYKEKHNINSEVVQNGIDDKFYSPLSYEEKQKIKGKLNLNKNKKIILFAGSLISRKDPIALIRAFKESNLKNNAELVILGDGPLYKECKNMQDNSILLRGKVNNVVDYLRAGDIFVSTSHSEGLPNAVLEAMGTGLPVLLSDIGPHKEIFNENNNIGILYSLGDQDDLIESLEELVNTNDLKQLGMEARKTIQNQFSAYVMSHSYQKIYRRILGADGV